MSAASSVANALKRLGRPMTLRRVVADADDIDVTVYGWSPTSDQRQFSNAEIAAANWPGPPDNGDRIIHDGIAYTVTESAYTQYLGTEILVHTCKVSG